MWRFVAPTFEKNFKTVLFDHVGAGGSDLNAYDKYSCLTCYAGGVSGIRSLMGSGRPLAIDNGDRGDE